MPALDGVRGVAVLLVMLGHAGFAPQATGMFGVTLFFALSGYLISGIILRAHAEGAWSLRRFLWRRAVRLVPALLLVSLVMLGVWLCLGNDPERGVGYFATSVLYVENWTVAWFPGSFMAHAWSLGVEEQFYLLWPFVLPWAMRSRGRLVSMVGIAVLLGLVRALPGSFAVFGTLAYTSTPMNAYALVLGSMLAIRASNLRAAPRGAGTASIVLLAVAVVGSTTDPSASVTWGLGAAVVAVPVVWAGMTDSAVLAWAPLRALGRVSYSAYLWHWPLLIFTGTYTTGTIGAGLVIVGSLVLATGSTLYLEEPLRRRCSSGPPGSVVGRRAPAGGQGVHRDVVPVCDLGR